MGGGGGTVVSSRRKPDPKNGGRGGYRRSRGENVLDESRKEMADRVARHQAG